MTENTIDAATRQTLTELRNLLLDQHKLLLDLERAQYEKTKSLIHGPGQLLNLVLSDPHFAWLKDISNLVLEIDEALSSRSKAGQDFADALLASARQLMQPREDGSDFQLRYFNAVQDSPDVVILQCRIEQTLGI